MPKDVLILALETSCDETSAAIVKNGRQIISNVVSSQVDLHSMYGGVVPEIASRKHVELIIPVLDSCLNKADTNFYDIDAISVTYGPGLIGALLVGVSAAKGLAFSLDKPLIGVNHIEGHIAANYLQYKELKPPFICLVVSGGHSHIVHVEDYMTFNVIGRTRDDAAGEAFDKVARVLGLGYPGGPLIDKAAASGRADAVEFPRTRFSDGSLDFSFSGIKTSVLNYFNSMKQKKVEIDINDVAASFQKAVVDVLVENTIKGAVMKNINTIALAGGVAANSLLRTQITEECAKKNIDIKLPAVNLCTDNAAMIASAAYYKYIKAIYSPDSLNANSSLKLGIS